MTPDIQPDKSLRIVSCPHPFATARIQRVVKVGGSIAQYMQECGIDVATAHARVFIDGELLVPKNQWATVFPGPGHVLSVRVIPRGGGGGGGGSKDTIRLVAALAVIIVASLVTYGAASGFAAAGTSTFAAGGLGATLLGAGIGIVGALAISAFIPPPGHRHV